VEERLDAAGAGEDESGLSQMQGAGRKTAADLLPFVVAAHVEEEGHDPTRQVRDGLGELIHIHL
jgi:hypothetical protein